MMRMNRAWVILILAAVSCAALTVASIKASADDEVIVQTALSGVVLNGVAPGGVAEHRSRPDGRRFKVQVENVNLPAETVLNVFVDGVQVGSLTVNSFRQGELELNSNDGQMVPNVRTGTAVSVRTQAGTVVVSGSFGAVAPTPTPTPSVTPSPTPGDERYVARFSASAYSVAEDGRGVTITVLRSGDISREAKVKYATVNETASDRSDYTLAFGALTYAAGESSKSFFLAVTDDSLAEGNETLGVVITDASNSGSIGTPGRAVVTIVDNDAATGANPITDTRFFIRQHYLDFLNREPEPRGLDDWSRIIENCEQGDDKCDRVEVSSAFFRSPEFQERGYFVYRFYETALGRRPLYAEFTPDMARLNGPQTAAEQEANRLAFIDDFMLRAEFKAKFDAIAAQSVFVDTLLQTVGVRIPQRDSLISDLAMGRKTRAQVLREIVESPEVYSKLYNRGFVTMEYFGYLKRDPDDNGYNHWVSYLDSTGDYRTLVHGFVDSLENRFRFGP